MRILLLFLFFPFLSNTALPQAMHGVVAGKVTGANALPLSYVSISTLNGSANTVSDEKGIFLIKVPVGRQRLSFTLLGYHTFETEVNVSAGKTADISVILTENPVEMKMLTVTGTKVKSATATRTLTEIQDIPQAISVIGQKTIAQQAAFDLTTIIRNISGVNFTGNYAGAGSAQFFNARGFDLNDAQNYRWNGVMVWNWGNHYGENIEQVEFLKGPASILFGDVAPGGIMNFVTKKPLAEFTARGEIKTGSWGLFRPAIDITGPLTKNKSLRYRLNASFERSNSFRDFVAGHKELFAPSISWNINPKLSLDFEMVLRTSRVTDDAGLVSPDGTLAGLRSLSPSLYLGEPALDYRFKDLGYFSSLTYALGRAWRLKVTGYYGNTRNRPSGIWFDQPDESGNFARRLYGFYRQARNATTSGELIGSFYTKSVKHNVLVGLDYQANSYRLTNGGELSLLDTSNIFRPHKGLELAPPAERPFQPYRSLIGRHGIYFQDQLMLFREKLQVLLGLRAGVTRQGNHYFQDQLEGTDYEGYTDDIIVKKVLTPRFGIVYKPKKWASLYASYATGYEVNAPDLFARNYKEFQTPPATNSSQFEAGSKLGLYAGRLGITVSAFRIDKRNPYGYVYLNPENPNYDEYNVYYEGHHRSQGVEFDASGQLSPAWSVTAGTAFTKTRVMYDPGYPTGNRLPNAPAFTGNIWLNFAPQRVLNGFSFASGLFYKTGFFSSIANDPNLRIPAAYTLDVAAGYQLNAWKLQCNVMNLTNQVSYLNPWQFNLFDVRPLRQVVISLSYRFQKTKNRP